MQHHAFVHPSVDLTSPSFRSLIGRAVLLAVITLVFTYGLPAQAVYPAGAAGRPPSGILTAPGRIISTVTHGDSVLENRTLDLNEEIQVIVQFVSPPLSSVRRTQGILPPAGMSMSAVQSQIERDHANFRSDLLRLEASVNGATIAGRTLKRSDSRVSAEYRTVFNGAALRSRLWLVERLRSLPYVRSIAPDVRVQAVDSTSNHQIGADSVWSRYGLTGNGVKVGVLDTGIDYMHPDLGGGIGPGFKVAAGWSFVDDVLSPMDDNGHGTHVAGIIAADGPHLQGVAPDATLYALKVLSGEGWGYASWIMSGLERAVDPDGNASTDDHLNIVNISIGGMGDPTDALSQAIDNATAAGVLCVVAAGNNGSSGLSISSPGCAEGALTVGACDSASRIAYFSSRGPTNYLYTIKPDLLAPGDGILSTLTGGTYDRKSGTSMATPHVAGAAALVLQKHPSWTPEMLKAVLMGSAKDLGLDVWTQGKGRVDVLNAMRARCVAAPQTLSFGLDDLAAPRWQRSDTVTVWNVSDTSVTFLVEPAAGVPAGVTITADLPAITVAAHGSAQLVVSCDVDNSFPSVAAGTLSGVTGSIVLVSPGDTLQFPWALVIAPYIELQLTLPEDMTPFTMILMPRSGGRAITSDSFAKNGMTTWHNRTVIPRGSYDVMLLALQWSKYGLTWFVHDSVRVEPVATLPLSDHDQLVRVGSAVKDENGVPLDSTYLMTYASQLSSLRSGIGLNMGIVGIPPTMWDMDRVSPLSSNYVFDHFYTTSPEQPRMHSYAGQTTSVMADRITDITAVDIVRRDIEYRIPSTVPSLKCMQPFPFSSGDGWAYFGFTDTPPLVRPFHQVWYTHGLPPDRFPWFGTLLTNMVWYDGSRDSVFDSRANAAILLTPDQTPGADGALHTAVFRTDTTLQISRGKKIIYGLGPKHYFGRMENNGAAGSASLLVRVNADRVSRILFFDPVESSVPFFLNQGMDAEPLHLRLSLRDSANHRMKQSSDLWPEYISDWSGTLGVNLPAAGRYTLQLWDPSSRVLSLHGAAIVDLTADTRLSDPNPPAMTGFTIAGADSNFTDMLQPGESGRVGFSVTDAEAGLRSVTLAYHTDTSSVWTNVPVTLEDGHYHGTLPAFSQGDGFISLRVRASDHSGNIMEYRAEPAVHIGPDSAFANHAPSPATPMAPAPGSVLQMYVPGPPVVFSWHDAFDRDGWDTLSYTFHLRGGILGSSADRWTPDTTVTLWLMGLMAPDQVYSWWVEATDGHVVVSSDTATFRTSSTILAAPGERNDLPKEYALTQNYPNPFNPTTTIAYDLPRASRVSLVVYTMLGQEVTKLVNTEQQAGRYTITFDGRGLASGVYIYRIHAISASAGTGAPESFTASRKLLLLR